MTLNKKHRLLLKLSLVSFMLILAWVFSGMVKSPGCETETEPVTPEKYYTIFPAEIPAELEFAGETVPLGNIDIRESLDRELLVNKYWQSQTLLFIKRSKRFFSVIEPILKKNNIPDDFKYLPLAESGLTNAVSPSGAVGIWQFLEGTAKDYGLEVNNEVDERYHLEKATEAACRFLSDSYGIYGSWTMAAASYNAGRNGINRQIGRQDERNYYSLLLSEETARYIFRILAIKLILSEPGKYGFFVTDEEMYPEIPYYEVTVDASVDNFAEFSKRYGISYKTLKWMNPWLRDTRLSVRSGKTYYIRIPRKGYFRDYHTEIIKALPLADSL